MSLRDTQRAFCAHLLDRGGDVGALVSERGQGGLAVYHNAYRAQLIAALRDSYQRVWAWLGDDGFEAAARAHIAAFPPTSWTLNAYGADFARTLAALYPDDPEVADLAVLDWALRRAFDGPDAPPIPPQRLASVDWDRARLVFVPTFTTVRVVTNAPALWVAMAGEDAPPAATMLPAPAQVRIWRDDLSPRFQTMDDAEAAAVAAVRAGTSFAGLCDVLAATSGVEAAVERAGALLGGWLADRMIADLV